MSNSWTNGTKQYPSFSGASPANPTFTFTNLKNYIPRSHPDFKMQTIAQLRNIFSYIQAKILESKEFNTWQLELSFSSPVEQSSQSSHFRSIDDYAIPPPPGSPESEGNENAKMVLPVLHDIVLSSIAGGGAERESKPSHDATPLIRRPISSESRLYAMTEPPRLLKNAPAKKRSKPEHPHSMHDDLPSRSKSVREMVFDTINSSHPRPVDLYPKAMSVLNSEQERIRATEKKLQESKKELERKRLRVLPKPMLDSGLSNICRFSSDLDVSRGSTRKSFTKEAELNDIRPLRPLRPYNSHRPTQMHEQNNIKQTRDVLPKSSSRGIACPKVQHLQRGHSQYVPQGFPRFDSLVDKVSDELEPCWKSQPDLSPIASPVGSPLTGDAISRSVSFTPSSSGGPKQSLDSNPK